jgi:hypothetical protein
MESPGSIGTQLIADSGDVHHRECPFHWAEGMPSARDACAGHSSAVHPQEATTGTVHLNPNRAADRGTHPPIPLTARPPARETHRVSRIACPNCPHRWQAAPGCPLLVAYSNPTISPPNDFRDRACTVIFTVPLPPCTELRLPAVSQRQKTQDDYCLCYH